MRVFNSFQVVTFFAALQYGLSWVAGQTFTGSSIALWGGAVLYLAAFAFMVNAVHEAFDKKSRR